MKLDPIDCKILTAPKEDGRTAAQELANRVGLSPSPCARRVRLFEDAGVISGYAAVIDQAKIGLPIGVFASIKLERQREEKLDRFSQAVRSWPEAVNCYLIRGSAIICCASSRFPLCPEAAGLMTGPPPHWRSRVWP